MGAKPEQGGMGEGYIIFFFALSSPRPDFSGSRRLQMFGARAGKSCWRHLGQRAGERHASWNPEYSVTAGLGAFPSSLLAHSPALSWPSVPKKHFQNLIITQDTTLRAAVSEAEGKKKNTHTHTLIKKKTKKPPNHAKGLFVREEAGL